MPRRTKAEKYELLYRVSEAVNEIAMISERKGAGEVGQHILDLADMIAKEIGLPENYKDKADEERLCNGGLYEAWMKTPVKEPSSSP